MIVEVVSLKGRAYKPEVGNFSLQNKANFQICCFVTIISPTNTDFGNIIQQKNRADHAIKT